MKILSWSIAAAAGLVAVSSQLLAQDHNMSVVTTAVPMLRISPDARAGGMGDAAIAVSPDASAVFWNRAKLPFASERSAVSLTYSPWLRAGGPDDVFLASLSGYYKLGDEQAISVAMRYFNLGDIQFTDEYGQRLQNSQAREYAVDAGYSRMLGRRLGIGMALRYIHSGLAAGYNADGYSYKSGKAVAGDITLYYDGLNPAGNGWAAGVTLSNLGSKISYTDNATNKDFLPANLGLGASYTAGLHEAGQLCFALDLNKLMVPTPPEDKSTASMQEYRDKSVFSSWFSSFGDAPGGFKEELKEWQVSAGVEYRYPGLLAIRGGYFYENRAKGGRQYLTLGFGLRRQWLETNFSYLVPTGGGVNNNPIRQSLRASLLFYLGDGKENNK